MNILKSIKNLYRGEDKFALHSAIFALTGMAAIAFVNIISLFLGHSIYSIFSVPTDKEAIVFSILGIMIFIFFTGYKYKYTHELFKDENTNLPTISMDCFSIFVKLFPLFFIWGIYYFLFYVIFGIVLGIIPIKLAYLNFLLLLLLPFINIVFITFSQNFEYKILLFNPLQIFKLIKQIFIPVMAWITQFLLLYLVITLCFRFLFKLPYICTTRPTQLSLTLAITCLSGYVQEIINLAYFQGLTKLIQKYNIK